MRATLAALISTAMVFSGCWHGDGGNGSDAPPRAFVEDAQGDAPRPWDLWNVTFFNLNGSFVLQLVIDNVTFGNPHPFYNVSLDVDRNEGGSVRLWASLRYDPTRPAPSLRPMGGGIVAQGVEEWETCHASRTGTPATVFQELVHAHTGLEGGGVVRHLAIQVTNATGDVHDTLESDIVFGVRPGTNPYVPEGSGDPDQYCPFLFDPASPQHPSNRE